MLRDAARSLLWTQYILARAVDRVGRAVKAAGGDKGPVSFCYTDTHAGSGRIEGGPELRQRLQYLLSRQDKFQKPVFFDAIVDTLDWPWHPGSWLLAGHVLDRVGGLELEIDVNDIDAAVIAQARQNRDPDSWVRFWCHDWFLFLRSRLALPRPPQFVFIDPSPTDARGPSYVIDAGILLDTLNVPYLGTYTMQAPQEAIDQLGRSGLELVWPDGGCGVVLGGGAESLLLDILPDLRRLAEILGGEFVTRLPTVADYTI